MAGTEATEQPLPRRRILVAEDGSMFRSALRRLLGGRGYEVEACPDGGSALARLSREAEGSYDLLIADIVMPDMNGTELVERMRSTLGSSPPVLYMSGDVRPALDDASGRIGGDPILAKPFTAEQLFEAIDSALG